MTHASATSLHSHNSLSTSAKTVFEYIVSYVQLRPIVIRAGFTLSGGPVQKKMWGPLHLFFSRKKLATFFCSSPSFTRGVAHYFGISGMQKIRHSFCGGPFLSGSLFARTCWTCLNPPLVVILVNTNTGKNW